MHDQIIRQLHQCMMHENGETDKISSVTKEAADQILKDLDSLDDTKIRDAFYLAASAAEENGFVKGFICAFRLFAECSVK